jgi:hypothetical protein
MIEAFYFQQPLALLTGLAAISGLYIFFKASGREGRVLGITRTLFFVFLAVALAGPFIQDSRMVEDQQEVFLLNDESRSTGIFENPSVNPDGVDLESRTLLTGNNSNLASALESELRADSRYLLVSDGRSSEDLEKVLQKYRDENSTISVLKPDTDTERAVRISGPSTTVPGAATEFTVEISSTEAGEAPVKVMLDNETVLDSSISSSWSFNRSFGSEGTHRIKAEIESDDRYTENNNYYKTVEVQEKPEILYIGQESELSDKLSEFYTVTVRQEIPEDLSDYYTTISTKKLDEQRIGDYIAEGNGYIYLGDYSDPGRHIPLKPSNEDYNDESTRMVMPIQVPFKSTNVTYTKNTAGSIVKALPGNTKFGGIYYSNTADFLTQGGTALFPQEVSSTEELITLGGGSRNRQTVLQNIRQLDRSSYKRHDVALKASQELLGDEGNIILVTNGDIVDTTTIPNHEGKSAEDIRRDAIDQARGLDSDIDLYAVRTGPLPDEADQLENVDRSDIVEQQEFMQDLADAAPSARSNYYNIDELNKLAKLELGAGGGTSAFKPVGVLDEDHFITRGIGLRTEISEFDEVRPKPSADVLVSGPGKREFLTAWNYGLGRVAAFSGDQGILERTLDADPGLVSRTASWTVGNPDRKQDRWVDVSETEAPTPVEVKASFQAEGLTYSSEDRYTGQISPDGKGFHSFAGENYSYNYNSEIEEIGYRNDVLSRIASETGGEVYTPSELEEADFGGSEMQEVNYSSSLSVYFLAAALVVLLSEVGYRKLNGKK